jgi:small-conductance mechanosensitive channel
MAKAWQATVEFLSRPFLGIALGEWLVFLLIWIGVYLALGIITSWLRRRLQARALLTEHRYDDYLLKVLDHTMRFGLLGLALLIALSTATLGGPYRIGESLRPLAMVMIFIQIGIWGMSLVDALLEKGFETARVGESAAKSASGIVRWFAVVLIWGCVILVILSGFGVEITPLIAGLGVGGIAIAFALQQILGDVFCSVAIVMDKPFEVGDFIIVGDFMGTVERIGIKTTRVRSLSGEQIIFSNSDLLGSRVRNYKRMQERRVVFGFGVLYSTSVDQLRQIPDIVKEIITAIDGIRFDRAHFQKFGDSSLDFEVVYYVLSADYNLYMDIQQRINLELLSRLEALGVEMAFPSRTIYLDPESAKRLGGS